MPFTVTFLGGRFGYPTKIDKPEKKVGSLILASLEDLDEEPNVSSSSQGGSVLRNPNENTGSKNRNSKMGCPGRLKHGPKPAVCPSCLILGHIYMMPV